METLLLTINENTSEPQDYLIRKVVRAVIPDESGTKVLLFGSNLPGGGVEENETDEEALVRECMEEVGARIEIVRPIGEAVAYRDFLKKKYVVRGYLCRQIGELVPPTSADAKERSVKIQWLGVSEAMRKLEDEITELSRTTTPPEDDTAQSRIHNRKISLAFLKEIAED